MDDGVHIPIAYGRATHRRLLEGKLEGVAEAMRSRAWLGMLVRDLDRPNYRRRDASL
jgi:hypothetical protein